MKEILRKILQKVLNRLSTESVKLYPLYYSAQAIKNHQKSLQKIRDYVINCRDIGLKEYTLPTLMTLENDFWHNSHFID